MGAGMAAYVIHISADPERSDQEHRILSHNTKDPKVSGKMSWCSLNTARGIHGVYATRFAEKGHSDIPSLIYSPTQN